MNIKILFSYINMCKKLGIEPTWEGLKENAKGYNTRTVFSG